jgi:hypothetical protein
VFGYVLVMMGGNVLFHGSGISSWTKNGYTPEKVKLAKKFSIHIVKS